MEVYVAQFIVFVLLFARTTSMIVVAPVLGHQAIPMQLKVGFGMFLSFVLFPLQAPMASTVDMKLIGMIVLVLEEVIVGIVIGFAAGLIFGGVRFAGELIGFDMGFTMATTIDPEMNGSTPVVGEMLYTMTALVFVLLNGHHFIIQALVLSYQTVPIGKLVLGSVAAQSLVGMVGLIFVVAVKFAAPVIVALFLTNIALGILTRLLPQMNVFGVAFPLKIGVGLISLSTTIPIMIFVFKKLLIVFENNLLELVKAL
jgi:flagellar biosynthesis protein FliR